MVLPADAGPMLISEAIAEVDSNTALRSVLRELGAARVRSIEAQNPSQQFMQLIGGLR
jgi:hypothetical protein